MTDAFAEIDAAATAQPPRQAWTDAEREIVEYGYSKVAAKTLLAILNNTNKAAGRPPRTLVAMVNFIQRHVTPNHTEGNGT